MKNLILFLCLAALGCTQQINCPDKKGCSYKALAENGDTVTVYQVHYDGLNVYNIGEPVHANECMDIEPMAEGLKEYTIISESEPVKR